MRRGGGGGWGFAALGRCAPEVVRDVELLALRWHGVGGASGATDVDGLARSSPSRGMMVDGWGKCRKANFPGRLRSLL
jgi:hypothetical protein